MWSAILPFRPVLRHFIRNIWYLRFFLFLIALILLLSSGVLALAEGSHLDPDGTFLNIWGKAIGITLRGFFFSFSQSYTPVTVFGKAAEILNSFISYILLGILIWVVEQSLSGHHLKKSRYLLFPTEDDI